MDKFLTLGGGGLEVKIQPESTTITSATVVRQTKPDERPVTKLPAAGIGLDAHC
jgi:hypothetical protein